MSRCTNYFLRKTSNPGKGGRKTFIVLGLPPLKYDNFAFLLYTKLKLKNVRRIIHLNP